MGVDFKELYAYSVSRIKENINFNYQLKERYSDEKEFYQGAIFGLFECLDMMRSDVIIASDEQTLAEVGLDFEPFDKMDSGTMFDDVEDYHDYDFEEVDKSLTDKGEN